MRSTLAQLGMAIIGVVAFSMTAGAQQPAATPDITIRINDTKVLHTVADRFSGTNFVALWNPTVDSPGTVHAFSQMGMSLLRFPGGVPAQFYDWEKPLDSGWTVMTPQRVWAVAKAGGAEGAEGAEMVFQTNIASDKTDTDKKTGKTFTFNSSGAHQAGWVKFAKDNGIKVAFWEIGNEPEMDAPKAIKDLKFPNVPAGRERDQKLQQAIYDWYNAKYAEQVKAIREIDPNARVMGPAATNTWFWWALGNLEKFMIAHGDKQGTGLADAISLHWYIEGDAAWEKRRSAPQSWQQAMDYVNATLAKYDTRKLPVYITEWNFAGGDKNALSTQLAGALGNADVIGMFLRTGVAGHNHFCLQRLGKNWGVLAMKDDIKPENEPAPTYFALAMTSQLGPSVLQVTNSADERNILSAYATRKSDGSIQLLLINKSDRPQNIALNFEAFPAAGKSVQVYSLQGTTGQLADQDVIYNGVRTPKPATEKLPPPKTLTAQSTTTYAIAPYSMSVLIFGR